MRHPRHAAALALLAAAAGGALAQPAPKVLETLGLQIGQSPDEVEGLTRSLGYVLQSKKAFPARPGLPERTAEVIYVKRSPQGDRQASIGIGFGPVSGKALVIAREEIMDKGVSAAALRAAMVEKYGPPAPSDSAGFELHWYELKDRHSAASPSKCWPASYPVLSYQQDLQGRRHCRAGVEVLLGRGAQGASLLKISLADFERSLAEWTAYARLLQQDKSADVVKEKAPAVPRI